MSDLSPERIPPDISRRRVPLRSKSDSAFSPYNSSIAILYTLLLAAMILSDGGAIRLAIYAMPIVIIFISIMAARNSIRIDPAALWSAGFILAAFSLASIANSYLSVFSRQYIFIFLAPASLFISARFDRKFVKQLTIGLITVQVLFLFERIAQGRLHLSFDIFNGSSTDRVASESFVCFPLSAVALYFGMTRQYRWLAISLVGVLLGLRRGPLLADLVGIAAFYISTKLPMSRFQIALISIGIFCAGAIVSVNAYSILAASEGLLGPSLSMNQFTNGRFEMYQILDLRILESTKSFVVGNGPGFSSDFLYSLGLGAEPWDHPHNDFLAILLDCGTIGFCFLVASWLVLIGRTKYTIALVTYTVMLWFVDNTLIYYFHLIVVLFVVWALREEKTWGKRSHLRRKMMPRPHISGLRAAAHT